jgi:hypothetical protein
MRLIVYQYISICSYIYLFAFVGKGMNEDAKTIADEDANDSSINLKESEKKLLSRLEAMRTKLNVKTSNAKMISIVHQCPCRLKCLHDITKSEYADNSIDPLYLQKHDIVKKRIIDAIVCRFSDKLKISSEHKINNGTADISISCDPLIRINNGKKVGIEVKSGKCIDYFQIERYLYELDVLLVVRVPTRDVVRISQKNIAEELNKNILLLTEKIQQINTECLIKVEGEWCRGCTALCEYKRPGHLGKPNAAMADYSEFIKNVKVVVEKVMHELEFEFGTN